LTAPGDFEELGARLQQLVGNESLRLQMSTNAATDARMRFGLERQAQAYLEWYQEIIRGFDKSNHEHGSKENMNWKDCADR